MSTTSSPSGRDEPRQHRPQQRGPRRRRPTPRARARAATPNGTTKRSVAVSAAVGSSGAQCEPPETQAEWQALWQAEWQALWHAEWQALWQAEWQAQWQAL